MNGQSADADPGAGQEHHRPHEAAADDELHPIDTDHVDTSQPGHADTGSAAGVGGVTGAAIGALAGPLGALAGGIGGMIVGAATERIMHADDDARAAHAHAAESHVSDTTDTRVTELTDVQVAESSDVQVIRGSDEDDVEVKEA